MLAAACGDGGDKPYRFAATPTPIATRVSVPAGALDPSFGDAGVARVAFGGLSFGAADLFALADGRIVVGGTGSVGQGMSFALVRYQSDGTLDPTFGDAGISLDARTQGPERGGVERSRMTQTRDGAIVAVGCTGQNPPCDWVIARYSADGVLDETFGERGVVVLDRDDTGPTGVAVTSDGSVIVAGSIAAVGSEGDYLLVRLTTSGTLDPRFGSEGLRRIDVGEDAGESLLLEPDGRILLGGCTGEAFTLLRLLPDGSFDPTFGSGGVSVTSHPGLRGTVRDVLPGPNGDYIAAGTVIGHRGAIARFKSDGRLDPSFGSGGAAALDERSSAVRLVRAAADGHGGIVAAGQLVIDAVNVFGLVRVDAAGLLDPAFGDGGVSATPIGSIAQAHAVAIAPDGGILAAGLSVDRTTFFTLARYGGGTH